MKRRTFNIWRSIIGLVVISLVALGTMGWLYVKKAPDVLSRALSEKLKTRVEIADITFSWNAITIHGLKINSIDASILPYPLTTETITIRTPIRNYLKDNVLIESITIDQITLGLEFDDIKSPKGNWTRLIENLYTEIDNEEKIEAARTVTIDTLTLTNINTEVVYKTKPHKIMHLPHIDEMSFTDITSHGGFPIDQITNSVLGKMLLAIFERENLQNMLKELLNPANTLKNLLSPFKYLIP